MKMIYRLGLSGILMVGTISTTIAADPSYANYPDQPDSGGGGDSGLGGPLQKLLTSLNNLGIYLGFDLTATNLQPNKQVLPLPPFQQLIDMVQASQQVAPGSSQQAAPGLVASTAQLSTFNTVLGAIPVNTSSTDLSIFVSNDSAYPAYAAPQTGINGFANASFQGYETMPQQQGKVGVSKLIDQPNYQKDPVSQAVLNILGTPDYSFCMTNSPGVLSTWLPDSQCALLYQTKVMNNVIGPIPSTQEFFNFKNNKNLVPQLNSNALLAPMIYSTTSSDTTSQAPPSSTDKSGLSADSQAQMAANFIRYVSGAVKPLSLAQYADYDKQFSNAISTPKPTDTAGINLQRSAQATLTNYLTSLRTYAAQASVGMGNLYFILSKRMPQSSGGDTGTTDQNMNSQALSEFVMATWRLKYPNQTDTNKQWLQQINMAAPEAVQKEIAILLAEMNYQMYLSRQQQERILLTNSILLLQSISTAKPTLSADSSGGASNLGGSSGG